MKSDIFIHYDGDCRAPEIEVLGSNIALKTLGVTLNQLEHSKMINLEKYPNEFYPFHISELIIDIDSLAETNRLSIFINEQTLQLVGNAVAFAKLGTSLTTFFDKNTVSNEHFHLDSYEGNDISEKTPYHLIFMCK